MLGALLPLAAAALLLGASGLAATDGRDAWLVGRLAAREQANRTDHWLIVHLAAQRAQVARRSASDSRLDPWLVGRLAADDAGAPASPTPLVISASDGFDWRDAGIGSAVTFGVFSLGAAATAITRRARGRPARV
jgi:hypothetical protein